jgi:putative transposase
MARRTHLASIRTIYRVLAELGESKERRNQRLPHPYVKPSLTATGPNQVWTWDITKLATLEKGVFLHAYLIYSPANRCQFGTIFKDTSASADSAPMTGTLVTARNLRRLMLR